MTDRDTLAVELSLYKRYLDTLGKITSLLLENTSEQNWAEVLKLLAETTQTSHCCLFLNDNDASEDSHAKLVSTWSTAEAASSLSDFSAFRELSYAQYPLLSDKLHIGMVLADDVANLPAPERTLFGTQQIDNVLCIPLLVKGELEGFLGFFCQQHHRDWQQMEIGLLCAIANDLSLSLSRKRAEQNLRASEARLRTLVGATEDIVIEYDERGIILNVWTNNNSLLMEMDQDLVGRALDAALPADMSIAFMEAMPKVLESGGSAHIEYALTFLEGDRYFMGRLQAVPSETGHASHVVALVRDVTALMQEEARRQAMLNTLDLLDEAIIDLNPRGTLVSASAAWATLCGAPASNGALLGPLLQYVHKDDHKTLETAFSTLASGKESSASVRFRIQQRNEEHIWVECRLLALSSPQGHITSLRGILRDITSTYLQEKRITQMALHDALTQLPNRILLEDHLYQAIARAQRNNGKVALGFIDLDHFKQINDTLGHKAGDTVLLTLSQRLQSALREIDTLSRWGGDEFVVLLPDVSNEADFRAIADRLRDATRETIDLDGIETRLTISVGFAIYPDDADNADTLMSVADHTMFHAKNMGRNNVQFYQDIHDKGLDRENVLLQTRFSQAVQEGHLQVFYQPIIDVGSGRIIAVEALARWHDDQNGWIAPDIFIPMAEHLGIIQELGEQVFDHALERLKIWREQGYAVRVALNLARAQLFAPDFVSRLVGKLGYYHLKPQDIILEITEGVALLDISYESKRLHELASAGFSLAIDDFGTGSSGLAQVHQMPIHILKIDSSFTSRLHTEDGRRIVQAIVQMADALALETIMEGVEDEHAAQYLQQLGVRQMQGMFFHDPVPAGMCEMLMAQDMRSAPAGELQFTPD